MKLNGSNQNYFLGNYESNNLRYYIKLSFSPKASVVTVTILEFIKFPIQRLPVYMVLDSSGSSFPDSGNLPAENR